MTQNKVAIIGLGYVGLPLALAIAKKRQYSIVGYDLSEEKIALIKKGISPIDDNETHKELKRQKLTVSTDAHSINGAQFLIVCVPTPVKDNKLPDLTPVKKAAQSIAKQLEKGQYVIIESTINPGVCEEVVLPILERTGLKGGRDFELSHCPERINPGDSHWNVKNIPRNIGSLTKKGNHRVAEFYRSFLESEINEVSSLKVAEATKIIENTFRDINIAYVNELAKSFDAMGIDLVETIVAAGNKPFAFMPHYPGCGVGGHCIPVDPYYLITRAQKAGFNHSFLRKARSVNNSMPAYTIQLLEKILKDKNRSLSNTKIGLLGLSYKPNIADLRESPAIELMKILISKRAQFKIFDPYISIAAKQVYDPTVMITSLEKLFAYADVILLGTAHRQFTKIPIATFTRHHIIAVIDGRNCLSKSVITKAKITYKGIGH